MGKIAVVTIIQPSELGIEAQTSAKVGTLLANFPRASVVETICKAISSLDLSDDYRRLEEEFLSPELLKSIGELRRQADTKRTVFHFSQLFLVLAMATKYGSTLQESRALSQDERFALGEMCLHTNSFCEPENQGGDWANNPTGDDLQNLMPSIFFGLVPVDGFMSIYRSFRILFHGIPKAEQALKFKIGGLSERFQSAHGISLDKAWALLGFFCARRYTVANKNPVELRLDMSAMHSLFDLTPEETQAVKQLVLKDLNGLSSSLPDHPAEDLKSTFGVFIDTPLIEIGPNIWWAHGPLLIERLLRTFYFAMQDSLSETTEADLNDIGSLRLIFGHAVEFYIEDLLALAKGASSGSRSLSLVRPRTFNQWNMPKPDFEIGMGPVRQLIEVKSNYFVPTQIFNVDRNTLVSRIEQKLLTDRLGVGQLASYTVARHAGFGIDTFTRIQSILVVLEPLPTFVPGLLLAAKEMYSELLDVYSEKAVEMGFSVPTLGPAHRQILVLSMGEFEAVAAHASSGSELKDILDFLSQRVKDSLLSVQPVLDEVPHGSAVSYKWLGTTFDDLFGAYEKNLYKKPSGEG